MKKRILSILLAACMTLSLAPAVFAADGVMADVKADDWFAREVAYVYENNLMNGVGDNAFQPEGKVSRAMVWTTLARMDGVTTAGSDPWYRAGQNWAMVTGVSDGTDPNGNITREQLVTMMYRYAQLKGYDVSVGENTNILSYDDAFSVSEWAVAAMQWACGTGLINGIGTKLEPRGSAIRAELAVILYRYAEKVTTAQPEPEVEVKPETYTVTFRYNYGSKGVFATVTVEAGQAAGSVGRPSRSGYTFAGWYTSDGERFTSRTVVTSDMTVQAKWKEIVEEEEEIPVHSHQYTNYVSSLDGTHTGTCSCGDTVSEDCRYLEGGDVCYDCGYVNQCSHWLTSRHEWPLDCEFTAVSATHHTATGMFEIVVHCSLCDMYLEMTEVYASKTLEHNAYEDGVCIDCGYEGASPNLNSCEHENSVPGGNVVLPEIIFEDQSCDATHTYGGHEYTTLVCQDCGEVIHDTQSTYMLKETAPHEYIGGYCAVCGHTCGHSEAEVIPGKAASCTESGLT
jgi:uncharacterized repeat protein (TIGR02543 family)